LGTSAKESASADMQGRMKALQDRYLGGDLSAKSQYSQIDPYYEQGKNELDAGKGYLNQALSTRMMGVGQNIGESLMTSGVPKGGPQSNLFAGAMAPAIAQNQTELAGLEKGKASISMQQGGTLADLMKSVMGAVSNTGQNELGAIGGMKDSTALGDVMGGLTSAFSLTDIFTNPQLLGLIFPGMSKSGGGGLSLDGLGGKRDYVKEFSSLKL
jgi:hypothetical protein